MQGRDKVSCIPGKLQTYYVTNDLMLLSLPLKSGNNTWASYFKVFLKCKNIIFSSTGN